MQAEYFPPKEDVILQNEAPMDLYILVSGAVVSTKSNPFTNIAKLLMQNRKQLYLPANSILLINLWQEFRSQANGTIQVRTPCLYISCIVTYIHTWIHLINTSWMHAHNNARDSHLKLRCPTINLWHKQQGS